MENKINDIANYLNEKYDYMVNNNLPVLMLDAMNIEEERIALNLIDKNPNLKYIQVGHIVPQILLQRYKKIDNKDSLIKAIKNEYALKLYDDVINHSNELLRSSFNKEILVILIKALIKKEYYKQAINYLMVLQTVYDNLGINTNINILITEIRNNSPYIQSLVNNFNYATIINNNLYTYIISEYQKILKEGKSYIVLPTELSDGISKQEVKEICKSFEALSSFRVFKDTKDAHVVIMCKQKQEFDKHQVLQELDYNYKIRAYKKCIKLLNILIGYLDNSANGLSKAANYFGKLGYSYAGLNMYKESKESFTISEGLNRKLNLPYSHQEILKKIDKNEKDYNYLKAKYEEMVSQNLLYVPLEINYFYNSKNINNSKWLRVNNRLYLKPFNDSYTKKYDVGDAYSLYYSKHYNEALDKTISCIKGTNNIVFLTRLYRLLGMIYLQLSNLSLAIYYSSFALELAIQSENEYLIKDAMELFFKVKNEYNQNEEAKKITNFTLKDFEEEHNEDLEKIAWLIAGTKFKIESLQKRFNLSQEDMQIINLILAKEYYIQSDYTKGDYYFKLVEKSNGKTSKVKKMMMDIQSKKQFYKNRIEEARVLTKKM